MDVNEHMRNSEYVSIWLGGPLWADDLRTGKSATLDDIVNDRVDCRNWPTRDAAAPEEDC